MLSGFTAGDTSAREAQASAVLPAAYSKHAHVAEEYVDAEFDLSQVAVDDQQLVRDVCAVLVSLRKDLLLGRICITSERNVYTITAEISADASFEIAKSDMDLLCDVNPLRVSAVTVGRFKAGSDTLAIKVCVCGYDHPIACTDAQLVRVVKRRRWALWN